MGSDTKEDIVMAETPVVDTAAVEKAPTADTPAKEKKDKKEKKDRKSKDESDSTKDKPKSKGKKKSSGGKKPEVEPKPRSPWSVWIGNLPYTVTKDQIREFFKPCGGEITRVNLPKKDGKISGFAYVDFDKAEPVGLALAYSEQTMGGRAVLIKSASDFTKTGAPSRVAPSTNEAAAPRSEKPKAADKGKKTPAAARNKNPTSPTLFVGNLSFDVKRSDLKTIFRQFGDLYGVRVATFEDNPEKCKGFAYVDFKYTDDATKAMQSPELKEIGGRRTRIEYAGEDATKKGRPWEFDPKTMNVNPSHAVHPIKKRAYGARGNADDDDSDAETSAPKAQEAPKERPAYNRRDSNKRSRKLDTDNMAETKLQGLPVEFEGQKITFGD
ncbi:hypothetical protein BX661DRAFT_183230 [Kickxella alabastrina]|uniref:uncharacterized protein n=1 Tax=Kickxella alabastrina TaxID=61397 RepID=UPI00221E674A|nr:uncharacterized protein BX661DRAFT_183230 [Kickxella alabastrina]KAI7826663.1 hypothetical protein BX661DRAFT_183230 [Kickxella alabastrina]KAJ1946663.1 Nucleolar protein 13 [Kickxella alabastrina]